MKTDLTCAEARRELSAYLDGELTAEQKDAVEAHLESCDRCRKDLERLATTRRLLRAQPAENVPDLSSGIIRAVRAEPAAERRIRLRIASVAAVVAALVVATQLPGSRTPTGIAAASEISSRLQSAARGLNSYQADFNMTEYNYSSTEPVRRFTASVSYSAPESLRLIVHPNSGSPSGGDVKLVANPRAWSLKEPGSTRTVLHRLPFDGSITFPTDAVVPLDTFVDATAFRVLGTGVVANRDAYHLSLSYARAVPLVASLEPGGTWRTFHPSDIVDVWLDRSTWFPLQFSVRAGASSDRDLWAQRQGYRDEPGDLLLEVNASHFSQPARLGPATFRVTQRGVVSDASFAHIPVVEGSAAATDLLGLHIYSAGRAGSDWITAYTEGMSWLKTTRAGTGRTPSFLKDAPEELRLVDGRWAYYLPASESADRQVTLLEGNRSLRVETNLARSDLMKFVGSISFGGDRAPEVIERSPVQETRYYGERPPAGPKFAATPQRLSSGYVRSAAVVTETNESRTVKTYYRRPQSEFDSSGIAITQSDAPSVLLPSPASSIRVRVNSLDARWSADTGRLDWIHNGVYTSVTVPSLSLSTAARIADGLN